MFAFCQIIELVINVASYAPCVEVCQGHFEWFKSTHSEINGHFWIVDNDVEFVFVSLHISRHFPLDSKVIIGCLSILTKLLLYNLWCKYGTPFSTSDTFSGWLCRIITLSDLAILFFPYLCVGYARVSPILCNHSTSHIEAWTENNNLQTTFSNAFSGEYIETDFTWVQLTIDHLCR